MSCLDAKLKLFFRRYDADAYYMDLGKTIGIFASQYFLIARANYLNAIAFLGQYNISSGYFPVDESGLSSAGSIADYK